MNARWGVVFQMSTSKTEALEIHNDTALFQESAIHGGGNWIHSAANRERLFLHARSAAPLRTRVMEH